MPMTRRSPRLSLLLLGGFTLLGWTGSARHDEPTPQTLAPSTTTIDALQIKVVTGTTALSADHTADVALLYFDRSRSSLRKLVRRLNVHAVAEPSGQATVTRDEPIALAPRSKQVLTLRLPAVQQPSTKLPAVQQPGTKLPAVQQPTAQLPAVQQPTTSPSAAQQSTTQLPAVQLRLSDLQQVILVYGVVGPSMSGVVGPSMSADGWDVTEIVITWSGHGPKGEAAHGTLYSRSGRPLHRFNATGSAARWTTGTFPSFQGK